MKNANIDLHIHPFLFNGKNELEDVLRVMKVRNLDVIGLGELDHNVYPVLLEKAKKVPNMKYDNSGFMFGNNGPLKCILPFTEYNTSKGKGLQLLTVGYHYDGARPESEPEEIIESALEYEESSGNKVLIGLDHPYVDNGRTRTAGHIDEKEERKLEDLCRKYGGKIYIEWNGYSNLMLRAGLRFGFNFIGGEIKYHDINKQAEKLSFKLSKENVNVPIVPDTDLHARNKRHLKIMGVSRIITDTEGESPKEIISSISKNIFSDKYTPIKEYVSALEVIETYGIPLIINKISKDLFFKKPRS